MTCRFNGVTLHRIARLFCFILLGAALLFLPSSLMAGPNRGHGRPGHWRFRPHHGWHFQYRAGFWSPFYVWWWFGGRTVLGMMPTATVIYYSSGHYALRGDGFDSPYEWVWVPNGPTYAPPPPLQSPHGPPPSAPPPPPARQSPPADTPVIEPNESGRKAPGRTAGIIVGTLLGDLVGSNLSLAIDEADELRAAFVLDKNQNGEAAAWVNPNKGTEVTVVPILSYQTPTGEHCREYQVELSTEGKKSSVAGTACRQPDGQWKMVR